MHIKIMQYPHKDKNVDGNIEIGDVFNFMIPELNNIYSGIKYKLE